VGYRALVLVVITLHFAYLLFIPLGGFLAWRWPRIVPVHLAALAVAVASVTVHFECPLTTLQDALERRAGGHPRGVFVDRYIVGHVLPSAHDGAIQLVVVAAIALSYGVMLLRRARDSVRTRRGLDAAQGPGTARGRRRAGHRSARPIAR
jgi:hypothetical protein